MYVYVVTFGTVLALREFMRPDIYSASDYAGFETGAYKAYYGYEETDPTTDEWCFVLYKRGKEVFRARNTELLMVAAGEGPSDMLIAGLALYFRK